MASSTNQKLKIYGYKKKFNFISILILLVLLTWLITHKRKKLQNFISPGEKQWVWVEIKTVMPRDTSDYYYFGQISPSIVDKIAQHEDKEGLFILSNIRYWNDDDLLQLFENDDNLGDKVFQIQSIQNMTLLKKDPINIYDSLELHETALRLRKSCKE